MIRHHVYFQQNINQIVDQILIYLVVGYRIPNIDIRLPTKYQLFAK